MIVLDTNVLSEVVKPQPSPAVLKWFAKQDRATLFTTTITQAEMLYGLERLPDGKRKQFLVQAVNGMFAEDFEGHVLNFDSPAAAAYARLLHLRKSNGLSTAQSDLMIAAIALSIGAAVATRNLTDFQAAGLAVINPWDSI